MIEYVQPILAVDPLTLGAIAIGALAGGAGTIASGVLSNNSGPEPAPAPTAPASAPPPSTPAAPPQTNPVGRGSSTQGATPTFIGASATPENRTFGTRTLLGQ